MAICKMCHKTIPDGMDFCEECEQKRTNKADESYLDNLLSSVTADLSNYSESAFEHVTKHIAPKIKNETASEETNPVEAVSDEIKDDENIASDEIISDEVISDEVISDEVISDEIIPDETIPDEVISDEIISDEIVSDEIVSDEIVSDEIVSDEIVSDEIVSDEIVSDEIVSDSIISDDAISDEITTEDVMPAEVSEEIGLEENIPSDIIAEDITPTDEASATEAEIEDSADVDELLDSLLADMDAAGAGEPQPEPESIDPDDLSDIFAAAEDEHADSVEEPVVELSDEMIEEINSDINPSDEPAEAVDITDAIDLPEIEVATDITDTEGIPGIDEIDFSADNVDSTKLDIEEINIDTPSKGAPVVADTPSADASSFLSEDDLEKSGMPSLDEPAIDPIGDFDVDSILSDLDDGTLDNKISNLDADKQAEKKKKKEKKKDENKKSLFQRLFANIEEDPAEIAKREAKEKEEAEKKKLHEENQKKRKEASKEEKEVQKAEKAAQKEEEAKRKAELKRQKQEEAKEKARKKKEERLALEEAEVNEGKINRAGATILFVIFAILTVFIIVGTNIYSYNLSIKRAEKEFDDKRYNEAYYQVYGLKIQDEDIELYDKIMTVMYVNTQLNAYEYYMTSNNRDKALDSLLKGLQRYDKYLDLAELLGIRDDLNYVKEKILVELSSEFSIDEYEALQMVSIRDEIDYSEYIYALLGSYEVTISE